MLDLVEPTRVDRPSPSATWVIHVLASEDIIVRRQADTVKVHGCERGKLLAPGTASQLGAAITSAAHWTPEPIVDAEIVDDRPRYTYELIREAVDATRPPWMSHEAAHEQARAILGYLVALTELDGAGQ